MTYGKITSEGQIMTMPNPIRITFANPTEQQKAQIAVLDNWLEMVYTEQPPYNPETQYLTQRWEEQTIEGVQKAVQIWEIHEIPPEPETTESE